MKNEADEKLTPKKTAPDTGNKKRKMANVMTTDNLLLLLPTDDGDVLGGFIKPKEEPADPPCDGDETVPIVVNPLAADSWIMNIGVADEDEKKPLLAADHWRGSIADEDERKPLLSADHWRMSIAEDDGGQMAIDEAEDPLAADNWRSNGADAEATEDKQPLGILQTTDKLQAVAQSTDSRIASADDLQPRFICPQDGRSFPNEDSLRLHMRVHRRKDQRCQLCSKYFATTENLYRHYSMHIGTITVEDTPSSNLKKKKLFECLFCLGTFGSRQGCSLHMRLMHMKTETGQTGLEEEDALPRPVCCREGTTGAGSHPADDAVPPQKRFQCPVCASAFAKAGSRIKHMTVGHRGQMFTCAACPPGPVYTITRLVRHNNTAHAGVATARITCCPVCSQSFVDRDNYARHWLEELHHQNKLLDCPACGKHCSTKSYIDHHLKRARPNNGESFGCPVCGKEFYLSRQLDQHLREHF